MRGAEYALQELKGDLWLRFRSFPSASILGGYLAVVMHNPPAVVIFRMIRGIVRKCRCGAVLEVGFWLIILFLDFHRLLFVLWLFILLPMDMATDRNRSTLVWVLISLFYISDVGNSAVDCAWSRASRSRY